MNRAGRNQRKTELLEQIQQQRLDLNAARYDWLMLTASYDRGWLAFLNLRNYLTVGSGILAIWTVRRPRLLLRWARRGFGIWSTWRLLRKKLIKR